MAGDDELLPVDDKAIFESAIGDKPPAELPDKPESAPEPKEEKPRDEAGRFVSRAQETDKPAPEPTGEKSASEEPLSSADAIPSWRLREIREARDKEAQLRREAEERLAAREAQLVQILRQQQPQQPEQLPDLIEDPQGYAAAIEQRIFRQFEQREIKRSLERADEQYGEEFRKAYIAFDAPERSGDLHLLARVKNSTDPGREILKWHREQQTLREVGGDPAAYRAKLEAELEAKLLADAGFRQKALTAWNGEARNRPSTVTTLPNLSRAPGSAGMTEETLPVSDADFFADASRPMQRRR